MFGVSFGGNGGGGGGSIVDSTDPFGDGSLVYKLRMEDATATVGTNPINNGVTFVSNGAFGDCGSFNGSSKYLVAPSGIAPSGASARTLSAFIKTTDSVNDVIFFDYG